jgi:hypothetical protein
MNPMTKDEMWVSTQPAFIVLRQTAAVTLPTVSQARGNLTLSFNMLKPANRGTATLSVQHSRDLGIADPWTTVPATDVNSGTTNGIQAVIGSAEAGGTGKLFGRLQANP